MPEQEVTITGKDIQSVSHKLEEFGRQLSPSERVVIDWLLDRAASAPAESMQDADVQGYLFTGSTSFTPVPIPQSFSTQFNRALGFGSVASITVTGSIRVRGGSFF
jgi:hypothetical protein